MININKVFKYTFLKLPPKYKTLIVIMLDFIVALLALFCSILLSGANLHTEQQSHSSTILYGLFLILLQVTIFYLSGLYKGIWRYSSTPDLIRIIKGISLAILTCTIVNIVYSNPILNIRILLADWLLLIVGLGGSRLAYRIWRDQYFSISESIPNKKNIIIVGAGDGGERLVREIKHSPALNLNVSSFVDDDLGKRNKSLHGIPVMGGISDISQIVKKTDAKEIFIAIPSATNEEFQRIIKVCENTKLKIKTLPKLKDILDKDIRIQELRHVKPEDLLGRKEVSLDAETLGEMITSKTVAITGAGGSIGSELSKQVASFKPERLILFEMTEFFLYQIENKLRETYPELEIIPIIGDVRNEKKVEYFLQKHRPNLVIHAAAYKHVPMMEKNPYESIDTNIYGTENIASLAIKFDVEKFVMVSTDKAVNPTNVMGATKRIAEMVIQDLQKKKSNTKFMTVRFGNVLGSSGSVIPLFKKQIKNGGPLTVTHPEITRYFMTIPEAAQLVLQAGAIGVGGEIFVLEMGEPFKIVNLAKQMITLAGLKLGEDIKIKFTGLRPGEKLYEELLADQEITLPTKHPKVRIARARCSGIDFKVLFNEFKKIPYDLSKEDYLKEIKKFVPEFGSKSN